MRASRLTRLERAEAYEPETGWQHTEGLSALLAAAKALPQRDPWDMPSVEDDRSGLAKLLQEARQWEETHGGGAC